MTKSELPPYDVNNLELAEVGEQRIAWAEREMPVLRQIRERLSGEKPLAGIRIGACLHVTTETANLVLALQDGGAEVRLCASNPLSTQDDVAAALVTKHHVSVFAKNNEDNETYYNHIKATVDHQPHVTMDDGADLVATLHRERRELLPQIIGGTEETTTGVIRLKAMAAENALEYPIAAVNESDTKHLFDNRYGTGQSTLDGIIRATNVLLSGKTVVVAGYGWCGRGLATRARGMGAKVIVTEIDHLRALEATMDGFEVQTMEHAAKTGDIFITATGNRDVIGPGIFKLLKNGAMLANSGHFDNEIDVKNLEETSEGKRQIRGSVTQYNLNDGRKIYLLSEGRLVNLAAAEGHPASVMDMSFANQALGIEWLLENASNLKKIVYTLPHEIDHEIARMKLNAMDISIDTLTDIQERYLASWEGGT